MAGRAGAPGRWRGGHSHHGRARLATPNGLSTANPRPPLAATLPARSSPRPSRAEAKDHMGKASVGWAGEAGRRVGHAGTRTSKKLGEVEKGVTDEGGARARGLWG